MTYKINEYHGNYNISRRYATVKYIVVHYTAGTGSARNNCIYFSNGNRNASAHYFIDDDYIYEYADPAKYATWHVGDGKGKYGITNSNSIGIEVVNTGNAFSEAEIEKLTWLVQKLMREFDVPASRVVRHYDASRKQCPRYYVNGTRWKALHSRITTGKVSSTKPATNGGNTVNITLQVLQKGSKGSQVKTLQRLLVAFGYSVGFYGVDGDFGDSTLKAVKSFQKARKLDADGVVGANTWNALLK